MLNLSFSPFPEFQLPSFRLRSLVPEDQQRLFELRSDPQMMQYIGRPLMKDVLEAEQLILTILKNKDEKRGLAWAIAHPESNRLMGTISYWKIDEENHRGEIGYLLDLAYHRQGIMTSAMHCVLNYGFEVIRFHGIDANVDPENLASIHLLEKCGFTKEAHFKENYFFDGRYIDSAIYCLLSQNYPR